MKTIELTNREEKIVKRCGAQYKSFIIRHGNIIGWIGVVLFSLGILPFIPLPEWLKRLFSTLGFVMIFHGALSDFITIIGKRYERQKQMENKHGTD